MVSEDQFTATAIAATVRAGERDPVDVVSDVLDRIGARDGEFGAFVSVRERAALAEAAALAGRSDLASLPLAGVPVAIKDNVAVAGERLGDGSPAMPLAPRTDDHPVVARLRAAGAVVVGLTAVPELCVWGTTDRPGRVTRNPWNPRLTAGGSSGGAAAAVSAAMVPVAHGNDGMGSIRIPAAVCGLVGIKPGRGVVPSEVGANSWFGMSENGPLATTVADAALLLSVMAGDPALATVDHPEGLRVGIAPGSPSPVVRVRSEAVSAVRETADILRATGHTLSDAPVPYPANPVPTIARWCVGTAADAEGLDAALLQPRTRRHASLGRAATRLGLVRPRQLEVLERRMRRYFESVDVVLTPALATPPPVADRWSERGWVTNLAANIRYAPFAALWNLLGWPAVSVPTGALWPTGTPLAVQLAGPPGSEARLLGLAHVLEARRPWQRTAI